MSDRSTWICPECNSISGYPGPCARHEKSGRRVERIEYALRSQLAEREAEVERLREAGDALADAATGFCVVGQEPALNAFYRALANWHTATGGTTDG